MAVIPRVAKFAPKRAVPLRDAVGEVSGETVATYPPGAPIIAAGEIVSAETIEYLRTMATQWRRPERGVGSRISRR